jgi:hypothetical protein
MMNVIKNAGAPAPPPSGNQPVIIQTEKKSNTTCIVIITVVCLCCVAPIVVFVAMLATAASAISEIASNLPANITLPETSTTTSTTTTTTTTAVPCADPSICQPLMNICQPGGQANYLTGGEVWTDDDFPEDMGAPPSDSIFMIASPSFFDNNGDWVAPNGPAAAGTYDCVFTVTPADATEKIFLSAFVSQVNGANGLLFTDLTTDMTTCGNNYISINGVKKCGSQDLSDPANMANFFNVEFAAGESVNIELKTDNTAAMLNFQIFTGAEAPAMGE